MKIPESQCCIAKKETNMSGVKNHKLVTENIRYRPRVLRRWQFMVQQIKKRSFKKVKKLLTRLKGKRKIFVWWWLNIWITFAPVWDFSSAIEYSRMSTNVKSGSIGMENSTEFRAVKQFSSLFLLADDNFNDDFLTWGSFTFKYIISLSSVYMRPFWTPTYNHIIFKERSRWKYINIKSENYDQLVCHKFLFNKRNKIPVVLMKILTKRK